MDGASPLLKAALLNSQGQLELTDIEVPRIGREEILVKMEVCGVCGTDLEKLHGVRMTPPVLGHEVSGEIEQVGPDVPGYRKGDRVTVHHHVPCDNCFYCTHGDQTMCPDFPMSNLDPCGFAEYFRVPEINVRKGAVFHLPSSMTYQEAALAEPTGCCIRALKKMKVKPDESYLVIGCGPAGLTHIELLRAFGVDKILATDVVDSRLEWARKFGADAAFSAADERLEESILKSTAGRGVDKVVVASGSRRALESSLRLVRKGGEILLFGIPPQGSIFDCDASHIFIREISMMPSYSTTEIEMHAALEMIATKKINLTRMITHRFSLDDLAKAFRAAEDTASSMKIMVHRRL